MKRLIATFAVLGVMAAPAVATTTQSTPAAKTAKADTKAAKKAAKVAKKNAALAQKSAAKTAKPAAKSN